MAKVAKFPAPPGPPPAPTGGQCEACKAFIPFPARECWRCRLSSHHGGLGFNREHQGATLGDFSADIAEASLTLLAERPVLRGMFVSGPTGTGKTRLLAALAGASSAVVIFGLSRALMRETWEPETQQKAIGRLMKAELLLLDDLGREGRPSEAVCATLHEILSHRNGNYLPTAATSNYTLDQLAARYDEAIADRMRPWAKVVLSGASKRGRKAAERST